MHQKLKVAKKMNWYEKFESKIDLKLDQQLKNQQCQLWISKQVEEQVYYFPTKIFQIPMHLFQCTILESRKAPNRAKVINEVDLIKSMEIRWERRNCIFLVFFWLFNIYFTCHSWIDTPLNSCSMKKEGTYY